MLPHHLDEFKAGVICSCFLPGFRLIVEKSPITKTNYHYIKLVEGDVNDIIPGFLIDVPEEKIEEIDKWEGKSYKRILVNPYNRHLVKVEAFVYISS